MLRRLVTFENIGRFATLKQKTPHLAKLSLIFARNGYGKSTLCAALRSVAESEPNHIAARRRLGSSELPSVHFDWESYGAVTFNSGNWNAIVRNVHIFDQEFVHQNIHVGESVTREHKRSLLPIVLGEQGGLLSEQIRLLDQQQRDLAKEIKDLTKLIRASCPAIPENKVHEFCEREIPSDIKEQTGNAEKSLELAKEAKTVHHEAWRFGPGRLHRSGNTKPVHPDRASRQSGQSDDVAHRSEFASA